MQVCTFLMNEITVKLNSLSFSWGLYGPSLRPPEGPILCAFLYITHSPFCHIVNMALTFVEQSEIFLNETHRTPYGSNL